MKITMQELTNILNEHFEGLEYDTLRDALYSSFEYVDAEGETRTKVSFHCLMSRLGLLLTAQEASLKAMQAAEAEVAEKVTDDTA